MRTTGPHILACLLGVGGFFALAADGCRGRAARDDNALIEAQRATQRDLHGTTAMIAIGLGTCIWLLADIREYLRRGQAPAGPPPLKSGKASVVWQCKLCGARVSLPPGQRMTATCEGCRACDDWLEIGPPAL